MVKRTRLFRSTAAKVQIGDFVASSIVNGSAHYARFRGVVETITILGKNAGMSFGCRDLHFTDGAWTTVTDDDTLWIERTYEV